MCKFLSPPTATKRNFFNSKKKVSKAQLFYIDRFANPSQHKTSIAITSTSRDGEYTCSANS